MLDQQAFSLSQTGGLFPCQSPIHRLLGEGEHFIRREVLDIRPKDGLIGVALKE